MGHDEIRLRCLDEARRLFREVDPTAEQVLEAAKKFLAFVEADRKPLESID
jgi:hypothetical protein